MDFIHYLRYVYFRFVTHVIAGIVVVLWWFIDPQSLNDAFDWNIKWETAFGAWLWEQGTIWISPYLPNGVWRSISDINSAAQTGATSFFQIVGAFSRLLPPRPGLLVFVAIRGISGQGWIVLIELAIGIRILWLIRSTIMLGSKLGPRAYRIEKK